jgi:hypothetical protein
MRPAPVGESRRRGSNPRPRDGIPVLFQLSYDGVESPHPESNRAPRFTRPVLRQQSFKGR